MMEATLIHFVAWLHKHSQELPSSSLLVNKVLTVLHTWDVKMGNPCSPSFVEV